METVEIAQSCCLQEHKPHFFKLDRHQREGLVLVELSRKSAVQLFVSLQDDHPGSVEGTQCWVFGDFDSETARQMKASQNASILYGVLMPYQVNNRIVTYDASFDLDRISGYIVHDGKTSINTGKFRRLFAHEDRLDWVGTGQSTHGMFKETTEDRLSVLLDLSSFPSE